MFQLTKANQLLQQMHPLLKQLLRTRHPVLIPLITTRICSAGQVAVSNEVQFRILDPVFLPLDPFSKTSYYKVTQHTLIL